MNNEKKEFGSWWAWITILTLGSMLAVGILGFAMNSFGILGRTIVERKVFESSYQYTAGQKQKIATYEAQLAEIESQLMNPNLNENVRANLEAQKSAIKIQLRAARELSR